MDATRLYVRMSTVSLADINRACRLVTDAQLSACAEGPTALPHAAP